MKKVYIISCYFEPDGTSWNICAFSEKRKEDAKMLCDRLNNEHSDDCYNYSIESFIVDEEYER